MSASNLWSISSAVWPRLVIKPEGTTYFFPWVVDSLPPLVGDNSGIAVFSLISIGILALVSHARSPLSNLQRRRAESQLLAFSL